LQYDCNSAYVCGGRGEVFYTPTTRSQVFVNNNNTTFYNYFIMSTSSDKQAKSKAAKANSQRT